jgi:hypothetical protein
MKIVWSILAVLAGLVFIFLTHTGTDLILEHYEILTPPGKGFPNTGMLVGALCYRFVFSVVGCYITALLAPGRPMLHSLILGAIGVVLCIAGIFAAIAMKLPDMWYPVALLLVTPLCAWLGGKLASGKPKTEVNI